MMELKSLRAIQIIQKASEKNIKALVTIGNQLEGRRFPAGASKDEVKEWYDTLNLNT